MNPDDEKFAVASQGASAVNDEQYAVAKNYIPSGNDNSQLPSQIAGTAALGAGAMALGAGAKWMADPFIQKMMLKNNKIIPFMSQNNIPAGIPTSDIPKTIQSRISQASRENTLASRQFSGQLQQFDSSTRNGIVKDTANNLAQNYPAWRKSGWTTYGNGLQDIEDTLSQSGVNFDPQTFNQNVMQKSADSLAARGLTKEADNIRGYAASRASNLVDAEGNAASQPISFSNAKQAVTELANQNPAAARELKFNWGNHLQNDPVISQVPEVSQKLTSLNAAYTPFKQADNVAYKLIDPNTGGLSTKKITDALHSYVKGAGDPQTTAFLKTLGGSSSMANPIAGLSDQADTLDNLAKQRQNLLSLSKQTQVNNTQNIVNLGKTKMQADELASLDKGFDAQIGTRKGAAVAIAGGGTALAKAAGMFAGAPQMLGIAQAYQASQSRPNSNFMQGLGDMLYNSATGKNLYQMQQAAQRVASPGATKQDIENFRNLGGTQKDLDMARRVGGWA